MINTPGNARHVPRRLAIAVCLAALAAILALAWWAYHPGLSGDFLFDDFANLPALGATGPVTHWATFWRYITSGNADPTGRPLTLLTFLIDARNWPASPYPFKVTGVILHLLNGALLAWVLWWLGRVLAMPTTTCLGSRANNKLVIPGLPAGQNPESVISAPSKTQELDSGSPLRGVRNDENAESEPSSRRVSSLVIPEPSAAASRTESGIQLLSLSTKSRVWIPGSITGETGDSPGMTNEVDAIRPAMTKEGGVFRRDSYWPALAALFGAGAWLLHPLLVSTTLYIVQREAMLPATFVLIAMLGWMASREALARGHVRRALLGMALSAWLCTGLAVLSKANGALLPLLLLLVEWIVLSRRPLPTAASQRRQRRAVTIFLIIPGALVIAYLLYLLPGAIHDTPVTRGWTTGERLLTEARVLMDYLRLLFIPHAHSSGLFNDAFPVSTGWLHPATTLPCVVLILALIGAGFALRKRHPAIALALLFYFTAQLMESGWIPLELYYEHRNYLPAMLLFWPIGLGLTRPGRLRWLGVAAAGCILLALGALTWQRATLWGDGLRQAQVWAAINPDSARAQANAALYDLAHDRPRLAVARLELSLPKHPDDIQAPINLIGAECRLGAVRPQTLAAAEHALARTRLGGQTAFKWFNDALEMASKHSCNGLDFAALQATLDAVKRNPHWQDIPGRQQDLHHLQGELDLAEGKPEAALQSFNLALAAAPAPGPALEQAAYLGAHGYPKLGLAHLDYFATLPPAPKPGFGMPRIHAWVLREQGWWPKETAYLRNTLQADATSQQRAGTTQ